MSRRTFLVALSFVAFVSLGLPDGLLGVSWPSIRLTFGVPLDALGLVIAVTTAGYLLSSFLCGVILKRVPIGMLLAVSTSAAALALLGIAAAPVWPVMVALGFLAGLGGGAVDSGLNAYGATHFSARTLNWLHAFFGLGTTIGPLVVTGVLGLGLVWRWSYVVVGLAQLALALTFLLTRHRWTEAPAEGEEAAPPVVAAPSLETLRRPMVWLGMATFFFYVGAELSAAQWSYSMLTLGRGLPETTAGLFVSLYWGSLMVGRVLFGFVADRVPLVPALRAAILGSILGSVALWSDLSTGLSLAGLMLMGFCFAPIFASLISLTPARVGRDHADSAIGFQIAAAGLGGAAIAGLIGILARRYGLDIIGGALIVTTLFLLVFFEALMRRRPRHLRP